MIDVIVVCLVMPVLFIGSLVLIEATIKTIDRVVRIGGTKDEPDPVTPPEVEAYLNRRPL